MIAKSWRDVLKVHPAAKLFPPMPAGELQALGEDILKNGLTSPIIYWGDDEAFLLDGRNRLDAMERVGMRLVREDGRIDNSMLLWQRLSSQGDDPPPDPYSYVISANIHRRHLTSVQKGELIKELLKAQPERSDRAIAKIVGIDHKTVAAKREGLQRGGEIPHHEQRIGSDGKAQPAKKKGVQARSEAEPAMSLSSPVSPPKPISTNPDQLDMFAQSPNSGSVFVPQPAASGCSAGSASSPSPQPSKLAGASDNAVSMRIPRDPIKAAAVITKRWPVEHIRDLINALKKYAPEAALQTPPETTEPPEAVLESANQAGTVIQYQQSA